MRLFGLVLLAALGLAADSVPREEYGQRRAALRKSLGDGVAVLFGATAPDDIRTGFFQEANFFYLTGWTEPGAVLVAGPTGDTLFLPPRNERSERYSGAKLDPGAGNASEVAGMPVLPADQLETVLKKEAEGAPKVCTLMQSQGVERLRKLLPDREFTDIRLAITHLRMIKSPAELKLLQAAADASVAGQRAGWRRVKAGVYEYQVAAAMTYVWSDQGCERNAYTPIIGSGPNGLVLHYDKNTRRMDRGEMVVMDAAAECSMYASDITRTVPVSGKFTRRQRKLYNAVLGAEKAVIAALKPGMKLGIGQAGDPTRIAREYLEAHGKLGKYLAHGVSHHVGLDVHDATDYSVPLAPGMVITVEPGVYLPEEGIGIRVEDTVLITETGARALTAGLPREPEEIEKALASRSR